MEATIIQGVPASPAGETKAISGLTVWDMIKSFTLEVAARYLGVEEKVLQIYISQRNHVDWLRLNILNVDGKAPMFTDPTVIQHLGQCTIAGTAAAAAADAERAMRQAQTSAAAAAATLAQPGWLNPPAGEVQQQLKVAPAAAGANQKLL